eukprot:1136855-Pelagomonas_calceolata.AAC.2
MGKLGRITASCPTRVTRVSQTGEVLLDWSYMSACGVNIEVDLVMELCVAFVSIYCCCLFCQILVVQGCLVQGQQQV